MPTHPREKKTPVKGVLKGGLIDLEVDSGPRESGPHRGRVAEDQLIELNRRMYSLEYEIETYQRREGIDPEQFWGGMLPPELWDRYRKTRTEYKAQIQRMKAAKKEDVAFRQKDVRRSQSFGGETSMEILAAAKENAAQLKKAKHGSSRWYALRKRRRELESEGDEGVLLRQAVLREAKSRRKTVQEKDPYRGQ